MKYLLITILSILPGILFGQFSSNLGRFEVDVIKGCAPLDISITNLLGANCPCDVRFGDGNSGQNTFTHTYATPGVYTLEIDYQSLNPRTDQITIEVEANILPDFDIQKCSANRATIKINDSNYDQYSVDFDNDGTPEAVVNKGNPVPPYDYGVSGNFTIGVKGINLIAADNCNTNTKNITSVPVLPVSAITSIQLIGSQTIDIGYNAQPNIINRLEIATNATSGFQLLSVLDNSSNTFSIDNAAINTFDNFYCFRIGSFDACTNSSTYSEIVCTVKLDAQFADGQNPLNWNGNPSVINYTLCKNGACTTTLLTNSFTDIDIICEEEYCYQIVANYANGTESTSHEFCGTSFSTAVPDPIRNIISEVNEGRINIDWVEPVNFTPKEYTLLRGVEGESLELLSTLTAGPYLDRLELPSSPVCYQLFYEDICGNFPPILPPVCAMFLTGTQQLDNSIQLNWNAYTGYDQGVDFYRIEKYDQAGFLQSTFTTTSTDFLDANDITVFQVARYKIFAVPNDNSLPESYSNEVRVIKKSNISHPQAFTPNGDGLNDEFIFYGTFVKTFRLNIFNRWGELIFSSNQIEQGWDGRFNGELLDSGSFSYSAEITDLANRSYTLSGFFTLIRN